MFYLTDPEAIAAQIEKYATQSKTLWIDTEHVNYRYQKLRLSLIQILDDPDDLVGDRVVLLDVMDRPDLLDLFIERVMANPAIEKVFHNADYDVRWLGGAIARNVTCTWKIAQKIPYYLMPTSNLKLKTLAVELCNFPEVPDGQQRSDWGQRPLNDQQLYYAMMDSVYLAQVHLVLLKLMEQTNPDPNQDDVEALSARYLAIAPQSRRIQSEIEHIQVRLHKAMFAQNLTETKSLRVAAKEKLTVKADFDALARLAKSHNLTLNFEVALPKSIRRQLKKLTDQIKLDVDKAIDVQLMAKPQAIDDK